MENAENTARLPSSVKRILWILLAVLILALGAVIGWYVLHFRNYDAYKAIPLQPAAYTEGKEFEPLQDSLKAVPGFQLAAEKPNQDAFIQFEKTIFNSRNNSCASPSSASHSLPAASLPDSHFYLIWT